MTMIFLTGMPGAGKTYWGRMIAAAYELPFTDLDEFIEQEEGKPIHEIFEQDGEEGFRGREADTLKKLITSNNGRHIVASGGGTVTHPGNIELMQAAGCIVYLEAKVETLASRLEGEEHRRPLLTRSPFLLPTLQQMLSAREHFYRQAGYILKVESLTVATFAQIIDACTNKRSLPG